MGKCKYEKMYSIMMATTSKGKRLGNDGPKALLTAGPYCKLSTVQLQRYDSSYNHRHVFDAGVSNFPLVPPPSYSLQ